MSGGVPARSRFPRALPWIAGVALAIFALFVLPFMLVRNAGVRSWLLESSVQKNLLASDWAMRIASVDRFSPAGLEMKGIDIVHRGPDGERAWVSLGTLRVEWNPRHLLRRRLWAESIVLDSLVIHTEVPAPKLRVVSKGKTSVRATPRLPALRLGSFELARLTITGAGGSIATGSITMRKLDHHDGSVHGEFGEARLLYLPDSISVRLSDGIVDGMLWERFTLQGMQVAAPGLTSRLGGEIVIPSASSSPASMTALWEIDTMRPGEITLLSDLGVPFAEDDRLRGAIRMDVQPPVLSTEIRLEGSLLGGRLDRLDLQASRRADTLRIGQVLVEHRAGRVSGWGRVLLSERRVDAKLAIEEIDLADSSLSTLVAGAPRTRIDGSLRGTATFEPGSPSAELSGEIEVMEIRDSSLGPIRLACRFAQNLLTVDSLVVGEGGTTLTAGGFWETRTGRIGGSAALDSLSLDRYAAPFLPVPIGGEFSGRIDFDGTVDAPLVSGEIAGTNFRILEIHARRIRGDSLSGPLIPPGIGGKVRAEGISLYGAVIDSADFQVVWEKLLRVDARARVDNLSAEASVEIAPVDPGSLRIDALSFRPGTLPPWEADAGGRVVWDRGTSRIEDLVLRSTDGEIRASLDVGRAGNPLSADVEMSGLDLRLPRTLLGLPEFAVEGKLDLAASIGGTTKAPSCRARIIGRDVVAARWPVGNVRIAASLESDGAIRIDSLDVGRGGGGGRVRGSGLAILSPVPLPEFLRELGNPAALLLRRTALAGHLQVDELSLSRIVKTGLEAVPGGAKNLVVESSDPMTERIRTVRADQGGSAVSVVSAVGGAVYLGVDLSGSAAAPRGRATGSIRNLRLFQAKADSLIFSASYAPSTLTLDSLIWHQGSQVDRATGEVPLVLGLGKGWNGVPPDGPIRIDAELPDIDLAILGLLSRDILEPAGTLSGSISVRGTAKRLWPEGSLAIRDGGIRIPKREERLQEVQGVLSLDSSGVQIRSLTGMIGKEGRLKASGWWRDLERFNLEAEIRNATFFESGLYHVTANADLNAFPVATPAGSYPLIVGTVDVVDGAITGDLAKQPLPPAGAIIRPSPWRAEIDISAPGNLRMTTAIASVELGEGQDIHVSFEDPVINVSGRITVLGGRYRVLNNVFTITSGTVEFRDTGRLPEPILDVYAETSVTDRSIPGEAAQNVLVKIHVTGALLALSIDFSSEPERSQSEIVELLSLGRLNDPTVGSFGAKDPSRQYLFTEVVSQIESQLSKLIVPLEGVEILPGVAPGAAWKVSMRRTLLPQVSVAYSRELAGAASQEVNVRYNLRGRLYLNADVERLMSQGTPTDRYSLDLRMRFEY